MQISKYRSKEGESLDKCRENSQNLSSEINVWEFPKVPVRYDFRLFLFQVWFKGSSYHLSMI